MSRSALIELLYENSHFTALSFNDIGESYSGLSGKSGDDFGTGFPFVTYTNIFSNDIVDENDFGLVRIDKGETQNTVLYGDLLMTLSSETPAEVGVGAVYLGNNERLYLNSFSFGIHINRQDLVYPPYLAYLVQTKSFRRFILPFAQGSTRYNLQKSDFLCAKFPFPDLSRQKEICRLLDCYSEKIGNESKLLDSYMLQKQLLLNKLFI